MTDRGTPPRRDPWDLVEQAIGEEELARLRGMTPEQKREAERKKGLDLDALDAALDRILEEDEKQAGGGAGGEGGAGGAAEPAKVVDLGAARQARARPRRLLSPFAVVLAVAAGVIVVVGVVAGGPIVAFFAPAPSTSPSPSSGPPAPPSTELATHQPTPEEKAKALRAAALNKCATGYMTECEDLLDQAKALDPAGDDREDVKMARDDILYAETVDASYAKDLWNRNRQHAPPPPPGPSARDR